MKKIAALFLGVFVLIGAIAGISVSRSQSTQKEVIQYCENGNLKEKNGDYDGAIEEYSKALKINPEYVPAYAFRASSESVLNKNKEAIKDCDSAIWFSKKSMMMNKFFSFIAQLKDKTIWDECLASGKEIETAVLAPVYRMRGQNKKEMKDFKGARVDFENSMKYGNDNAEAFAALIWLKIDTGDTKGIVAELDEAINRDPQNAQYYRLRGEVKNVLGDNTGALQDLDEALKLKPDDVVYNNRADLKNAAGDYAGALVDINSAIRMDPNKFIFYCTRGEIESNMFKYGKALKDFNKAIAMEPGDGYAYYYRSLAKEKLNDASGALEDLKKASELGEKKAIEKLKEIQGK